MVARGFTLHPFLVILQNIRCLDRYSKFGEVEWSSLARVRFEAERGENL